MRGRLREVVGPPNMAPICTRARPAATEMGRLAGLPGRGGRHIGSGSPAEPAAPAGSAPSRKPGEALSCLIAHAEATGSNGTVGALADAIPRGTVNFPG
jgi:hypothetical protein